MQPELPLHRSLSGGAQHRRIAHGVMVDYALGILSPARLDVLPPLLARIGRYGVHKSLLPARQSNVLQHSVLVALLSREVAKLVFGADKQPMIDACGLYGLTHDVGEIFGGDVPFPIPESAKRVFQEYQDQMRDRALWMMGIPAPSPRVSDVVHLADRLTTFVEARVGAIAQTPSSTYMWRVISPLGARLGLSEDILDDLATNSTREMHFRSGGKDESFPSYGKLEKQFLALVKGAKIVLAAHPGICEVPTMLEVASSTALADSLSAQRGTNGNEVARTFIRSRFGEHFDGWLCEPFVGGPVLHRFKDDELVPVQPKISEAA